MPTPDSTFSQSFREWAANCSGYFLLNGAQFCFSLWNGHKGFGNIPEFQVVNQSFAINISVPLSTILKLLDPIRFRRRGDKLSFNKPWKINLVPLQIQGNKYKNKSGLGILVRLVATNTDFLLRTSCFPGPFFLIHESVYSFKIIVYLSYCIFTLYLNT